MSWGLTWQEPILCLNEIWITAGNYQCLCTTTQMSNKYKTTAISKRHNQDKRPIKLWIIKSRVSNSYSCSELYQYFCEILTIIKLHNCLGVLRYQSTVLTKLTQFLINAFLFLATLILSPCILSAASCWDKKKVWWED